MTDIEFQKDLGFRAKLGEIGIKTAQLRFGLFVCLFYFVFMNHMRHLQEIFEGSQISVNVFQERNLLFVH